MAMQYRFSALVNTLLCQNLLYFKILLIGSHFNLISTLLLMSAMTPKWAELPNGGRQTSYAFKRITGQSEIPLQEGITEINTDVSQENKLVDSIRSCS